MKDAPTHTESKENEPSSERKRLRRIILIITERAPNYQPLALCVYQLTLTGGYRGMFVSVILELI
jgi:hypothetical protein